MEVINTMIKYENKTMTRFEELICGSVFRTKNNYYMKTDSIDGNGVQLDVNAVSLDDGALIYFASYTDVEVIDAELIIKDESVE